MLSGKKVIALGERDGIPGEVIAECVKSAGAEIIFASTECFVWTSAGAMDLELQKRIKELADKNKQEKPIMIIGSADAEGAGIVAETVSIGDPSYAGPLTGVQLGLLVYHIVEPEVKREIDPQLYEEKIAMMEMVLEVENIIKEMEETRAKGSG